MLGAEPELGRALERSDDAAGAAPAAVAGLLLGVAAVATLLPARSGARVDPMTILRGEG